MVLHPKQSDAPVTRPCDRPFAFPERRAAEAGTAARRSGTRRRAGVWARSRAAQIRGGAGCAVAAGAISAAGAAAGPPLALAVGSGTTRSPAARTVLHKDPS